MREMLCGCLVRGTTRWGCGVLLVFVWLCVAYKHGGGGERREATPTTTIDDDDNDDDDDDDDRPNRFTSHALHRVSQTCAAHLHVLSYACITYVHRACAPPCHARQQHTTHIYADPHTHSNTHFHKHSEHIAHLEHLAQ